MTSKSRKPSNAREEDLRLALSRIKRGRAHTKETKVSIASEAREADVSTALIHNHYPSIAEEIRVVQARSSRAVRDLKHQELREERGRDKTLRQESAELREQVAKLFSINEVLLTEIRTLTAKQNDSNVVDLPFKKT